MAFRTVVISNEAELHVHSDQLIAVQGQSYWIPLEDIAVLVLENPRIWLSSAALSLIAASGVAVAVCDDKHMPTGILLPHCRHSRQLAATRQQLAASLPQKKRLWQRLIVSKVRNQALCLQALDLPGAEKLEEYAGRVVSGDATGVEGTAARYYFARLMPGVKRHSGHDPDGALDYGYAVVRAAVARALVGHGLYPAVGIHHDSQLNAFNLADDLLEPFRPFVDLVAVREQASVNNKEGRMALVSTLNAPCRIGDRQHSVLTGVEEVAASLMRAFARKDHCELRVPALAPEDVTADCVPE
ncbi:MAG: type II CRISPR-associated endonuclease Cas1 [Actinomycetota bacterium]|nr:type II CRISPR-associated endonuclease Cas1 [Actinomycetota bacterium]